MSKEEQSVASSGDRYQVIPRTLVFVTLEDRVLLLKGGPDKRLWAGKYNGLGGHVERGEDIYGAARREVFEEAGLEVDDMGLRGIVHIDAGDPMHGIVLFVFRASAANGRLIESPEGELGWHPINALPETGMVEDLPALLPRVLAAGPSPFFASYTYNDQDRLVIRFSEPTEA